MWGGGGGRRRGEYGDNEDLQIYCIRKSFRLILVRKRTFAPEYHNVTNCKLVSLNNYVYLKWCLKHCTHFIACALTNLHARTHIHRHKHKHAHTPHRQTNTHTTQTHTTQTHTHTTQTHTHTHTNTHTRISHLLHSNHESTIRVKLGHFELFFQQQHPVMTISNLCLLRRKCGLVVHVCTCVYVNVYMCVYADVCMCVQMCVCMCVCT